MKSKCTGTWRLTAMEAWESDYVHLTGPGCLTRDQEGGGFMQFGAVEDILGYLGDGETHAENQRIARRLESLIRRVNKELDSYEDGD